MTTIAPHSLQSQHFASHSSSPAHGYITYSNSEPEFHGSSLDHDSVPLTGRGGNRSSSPTPSEKEELKVFDGFFKKMLRKESWNDRGFIVSFVVIIILVTIAILLSAFHHQIVNALTPPAEWIRKTPGGFLIPIGILIVLSIPPLFGAEIVHILCGMVYGVGVGFLIVCAGTVLGESLTFFMFRYWLRARAEKLEKGKGNAQWAALARVIREGGFWVALVIRFSAIPTHVGTALFAACGMNLFVFLITLFLSLPRQLAGVYIGKLAAQSAAGQTSRTDKTVSTIVLVVTIIITVIAMQWINVRMKAAALAIVRERRARANAEIETKPLDLSTGALYDPTSAAESGVWHGQQARSGVHFDERAPSPTPRAIPTGAVLPTAPGPAIVHAQGL